MRDERTAVLGLAALAISCAVVGGGIALGVLAGGGVKGTAPAPRAQATATHGRTQPATQPATRRAAAGKAWWQGGTLHKATMRDWKRADRRDKLATCADFVTGTLLRKGVAAEDIDIEGVVRPRAEDLVRQIDAAGADGAVDGQDVAEIAALVLVLQERR